MRCRETQEPGRFYLCSWICIGDCWIALIAGAGAVRITLDGHSGWEWMVFLPLLIGAIGMFCAQVLAPKYLLRSGMVLMDIDAHWGVVDGEEEERNVYLEWTATNRPHRLRLLRQAWRFHRWVTLGLWTIGCVAAIGIWVEQVWSTIVIMTIISTMYLYFPKRLSESDPQWLATTLGVSLKTQQRAWWDTSIILGSSFWIPIFAILILGMEWELLIQTTIRLLVGVGVLWWMSHILRTHKSTWGSLLGVATNLIVWEVG